MTELPTNLPIETYQREPVQYHVTVLCFNTEAPAAVGCTNARM
eukprot:SAG11_NODE_29727_length_307_cov_220.230769_1_plen_42_part_10